MEKLIIGGIFSFNFLRQKFGKCWYLAMGSPTLYMHKKKRKTQERRMRCQPYEASGLLQR